MPVLMSEDYYFLDPLRFFCRLLTEVEFFLEELAPYI